MGSMSYHAYAVNLKYRPLHKLHNQESHSVEMCILGDICAVHHASSIIFSSRSVQLTPTAQERRRRMKLKHHSDINWDRWIRPYLGRTLSPEPLDHAILKAVTYSPREPGQPD